MKLVMFFEGTGQGVAGRITNVSRLYEACAGGSQLLHLETGAGTRFGSYLGGALAGADWRRIFRSARRWFESSYRTLPADSDDCKVFVFGFSRGAAMARHFAAWLDKLGIAVEYLGVWDTVDATAGLEVAEECPANVRAARHAVARDEQRRFFAYVPLTATDGRVEELVFPGSHSDVGGLYDDNHVIADVALAWIAQGAKRRGLKLRRGIKLTQKFDRATIVLHDSLHEISNLWGAFSPVPRLLSHLRRHRCCTTESLPSDKL